MKHYLTRAQMRELAEIGFDTRQLQTVCATLSRLLRQKPADGRAEANRPMVQPQGDI